MDKKRQSLSLKIVIVGDPLCGKTSLLHRCTRNFFSRENRPASLAVAEKYCKELEVNGVKILMTLWDTPCMDGYESIRQLVYPDTSAFLVCYNVDNPSSFANVETLWLPEICEQCPDAIIILTGTKADLRASVPNSISEETAKQLQEKYKLDGSLQCSAMNPESIEDLFREAVEAISNSKKSAS